MTYVDLALNFQVCKRLLPELDLSQRPGASCYRAWGRPMTEYAVNTRLAHFVVAFRIDLELHIGIEVARRLAYWANV